MSIHFANRYIKLNHQAKSQQHHELWKCLAILQKRSHTHWLHSEGFNTTTDPAEVRLPRVAAVKDLRLLYKDYSESLNLSAGLDLVSACPSAEMGCLSLHRDGFKQNFKCSTLLQARLSPG